MSLQGKRSLFCALLSAAAVCACLAAGSAPALADRGQLTFFDATDQLLNPGERANTFSTLAHLGVRALRLLLYWEAVAPAGKSPRVPNVDLSSPASYNWSLYLPVLEEAKRRHWPVLLTVTSPVPKWATSTHRDFLTRPNPRYFEAFMEAAGRALGSYVSYWGIWNEPNQLGWLLPQWNANGTPASPAIYRALYLAAYRGLQAGGLAQPKLLLGETAPFGNSSVNPRREGTNHQMAPLTFLQGLLCLNRNYRPVRRCPKLPAAGYGHHAYPNASGPSYVPPNPAQVTIGSLSRLVQALNRAARAALLPPNLPIYLTEYGINTKPNPLGVTPQKQVLYDALSEQLAWRMERVAAFGQYELRDDPIPRHHPKDWTGFQTGLEYANGKPKPLYYAFPLPLVVRKVRGGYSLWGLIRPAEGPTKAKVLVRKGRRRRFIVLATVTTSRLGYWQLRTRVRGLAWKVRWEDQTDHQTYEGPAVPALG